MAADFVKNMLNRFLEGPVFYLDLWGETLIELVPACPSSFTGWISLVFHSFIHIVNDVVFYFNSALVCIYVCMVHAPLSWLWWLLQYCHHMFFTGVVISGHYVFGDIFVDIAASENFFLVHRFSFSIFVPVALVSYFAVEYKPLDRRNIPSRWTLLRHALSNALLLLKFLFPTLLSIVTFAVHAHLLMLPELSLFGENSIWQTLKGLSLSDLTTINHSDDLLTLIRVVAALKLSMSIFVTRENKFQTLDFPELEEEFDSPIIFQWLVSLYYVVSALYFVNSIRSAIHRPFLFKHPYLDGLSDIAYSLAFGCVWAFFSEVLALYWLQMLSYLYFVIASIVSPIRTTMNLVGVFWHLLGIALYAGILLSFVFVEYPSSVA